MGIIWKNTHLIILLLDSFRMLMNFWKVVAKTLKRLENYLINVSMNNPSPLNLNNLLFNEFSGAPQLYMEVEAGEECKVTMEKLFSLGSVLTSSRIKTWKDVVSSWRSSGDWTFIIFGSDMTTTCSMILHASVRDHFYKSLYRSVTLQDFLDVYYPVWFSLTMKHRTRYDEVEYSEHGYRHGL